MPRPTSLVVELESRRIQTGQQQAKRRRFARRRSRCKLSTVFVVDRRKGRRAQKSPFWTCFGRRVSAVVVGVTVPDNGSQIALSDVARVLGVMFVADH